MAANYGKIVIEQEGSVRADPEARRRLARRAGDFTMIDCGRRYVVLRSNAEHGGTSIPIAGEIGGPVSVADVAAILAQWGLRGELTLADGHAQRRFGIDQGALKAVATEAPGERLGALMVKYGAVTDAQLTRCLEGMGGGMRLGELAVLQGLIEEQQLYELLRRQATLAFQNGLLLTRGHYMFALVGSEQAFNSQFAVHISLQGLLLQSAQRIDEMQVFRKRIPDSKVKPMLTTNAKDLAIADSLRPVAALSDGQNSVDDIGRLLQLDEFETTHKIYQLMQVGVLALTSKLERDVLQLPRLIAQFNAALAHIYCVSEANGRATEVHTAVAGWIHCSPHSEMLAGTLGPRAQLASDEILKRLKGMPPERRTHALSEALHDLTSYALFAAGRGLPRQAEADLNQEVQRVLVPSGTP